MPTIVHNPSYCCAKFESCTDCLNGIRALRLTISGYVCGDRCAQTGGGWHLFMECHYCNVNGTYVLEPVGPSPILTCGSSPGVRFSGVVADTMIFRDTHYEDNFIDCSGEATCFCEKWVNTILADVCCDGADIWVIPQFFRAVDTCPGTCTCPFEDSCGNLPILVDTESKPWENVCNEGESLFGTFSPDPTECQDEYTLSVIAELIF